MIRGPPAARRVAENSNFRGLVAVSRGLFLPHGVQQAVVGLPYSARTWDLLRSKGGAAIFGCSLAPGISKMMVVRRGFPPYRCLSMAGRVRRTRRRIHSGTWQHAMAHAGVRGEGLRWPSAGFRREPVVFFRAVVVAGL
jgi:hypothetical protein